MFDIGFFELLLIATVALIVLGPERLPEAIRTTGIWLSRVKRAFRAMKNEFESEIGMDEIRQDIHNTEIMERLQAAQEKVNNITQNTQQAVHNIEKTLNSDVDDKIDNNHHNNNNHHSNNEHHDKGSLTDNSPPASKDS